MTVGIEIFAVNPLVSSIEARRNRIEQVRENSARHAWSYCQLNSHGIGEIQLATVVNFDCTFIEEPRIATGFQVDGDLLIDGSFPTVTAGVWKWARDAREFYTGAYVFFVVSGDPGYDLQHDFTFSGIAIKDLPEHLMEH